MGLFRKFINQTRKPEDGYADCDLAIVCVPTDFSEEKGEFDYGKNILREFSETIM